MSNDNEEKEYEFESGWDYLVRKHLGTMITIAVIVIASGLIYISTLNNSPEPDCAYQDNGCQGDNRWGQ
jgi:hypothetical protein